MPCSLDYYSVGDPGNGLYIARCFLHPLNAVGRLCYRPSSDPSDRDSLPLRKVELEDVLSGRAPGQIVCDLPGDQCIAMPVARIDRVICARQEFARVSSALPPKKHAAVSHIGRDLGIPAQDMSVIGSHLVKPQSPDTADLDLGIYGPEWIEPLREWVMYQVRLGGMSKLPLAQDSHDQFRIQYFALPPIAVEAIRRLQWFRRLSWGPIVISFAFAPRRPAIVSLEIGEGDFTVEGRVTTSENSYFPPFTYGLERDGEGREVLFASFAWCLRHALEKGQRVQVRGSPCSLDGQSGLFIWRRGHFVRPQP